MPIVKAWVAAHTGLPSFYLRGPGSLKAGGRLVVRLADGDEKLVSDAGAPISTPTEYVFGGEAVTLSRAFLGVGDAHIADTSGRGTSNIIWENNRDPVSRTGSGVVHETGVVRFSKHPPAASGESSIVLLHASDQGELERVLFGSSLVCLAARWPVEGLPAIRQFLVRDVSRELLCDGVLRYKVSWLDQDASDVLPAPVVSWGEWEEWGSQPGNPPGWQDWSYIEVCRRVAGMPEVD